MNDEIIRAQVGRATIAGSHDYTPRRPKKSKPRKQSKKRKPRPAELRALEVEHQNKRFAETIVQRQSRRR